MLADSSATVLAPHPTLKAYYAQPPLKRQFLQSIFDAGASDYDHVERLLSLGSGGWYRRNALLRAGLAARMKVLDVAVGTGLVAREEVTLTGDPKTITGLDPSDGMLRRAIASLGIAAILGIAEHLPFASAEFDFLSMGYALRHLSDLNVTFAEFFRVLRPGGRLCILEITAPRSRLWRAVLRGYMRSALPLLTRFTTTRRSSQVLWRYYWDTIEACLPPETLISAISNAGFVDVKRNVELGIFSEYTACKPL